ncbi:hypothetical protein P3342_010318 [Pyrenophora teres f. teres]|nr:hypothetical protein P3342_010318 [Pyrenophora teres f. teres]
MLEHVLPRMTKQLNIGSSKHHIAQVWSPRLLRAHHHPHPLLTLTITIITIMADIRVSQKAQNLARIRDNQRRSRARRKEYLQELEAKLRSYEQIGIEASSEIQSAARRVLDENKKLRALLHEEECPSRKSSLH